MLSWQVLESFYTMENENSEYICIDYDNKVQDDFEPESNYSKFILARKFKYCKFTRVFCDLVPRGHFLKTKFEFVKINEQKKNLRKNSNDVKCKL